ncbi:receptor-type tyrosine-protein phosphatase [Holotrichia oblita]|uniref:Receptor-type tyrosine-protein phosphatase n=1 Tax=Holotrichia oblita TaxID=644536 RepID=A0ACB9TFL3_HOLOL|nr:receptor-type tyrosine-protein phosphatase [Holotrichia oblita]
MDHTYEELDLLPEVADNSKVPDVQSNKYSNRIVLQDLQNYVKRCLENQELEKQYEMMPMGQTQNWKCGMEPENKSKNRYKNVAAYDHTRVKLKVSNEGAVSDYINANYIDGYDVNKAYIATQGPKTNTINDFWQMVWQENVEYIIMIANITEGGKKKVEQYWPNITETNIYGNYTVTFTEILVFPEYGIKTFKVSYKDKERTVYHLHFTCWPDHGVPFYAQSLAPFLKRTITIPYSKAPIVVHCSAGIGRTGTLILSDICLRMAAKTGEVDVSYNLYKLRNQRINMVDNINQYKLVHLVLLHCLIVPDCTIQCTEHMEDDVNIALSDKIHNQMKYIEDSFWQDEAMRSVSTKIDEPVIKEKNRFENIVPDKYARIALAPYPVSDASSKYINAIKVDGFCVSFRFIVTQYPLSNTVGDFWRVIDQYEISVIICLNDLDLSDEVIVKYIYYISLIQFSFFQSCCTFYPKLAEQMQPTPYLKVECTNVSKETYYNITTINIQNFEKAQQQRIIKIVHLNKWKYSEEYPETPTALLMTYEEMNYLGKSSNTILVACLDGTRASGLFTALCCLIDKIKMEQICDVCLAVRTVRHSRGEFVRRSEQFAFLYKCGLEYVQQFEMYSNFSSQKK